MPSWTLTSRSDDARALIEALALEPHPEGGWYRETWRAPSAEGERGAATAVYFLLEQGQRSHWHRVDAAEVWLWHAGSALEMSLSPTDEGPVRRHVLGTDIAAGEAPLLVVP